MADSNGHIALDDPRVGSSDPALTEALGLIHMLAGDVGPRRPCSEAEKDAANRLAAWLRDRDVEARIEEFTGLLLLRAAVLDPVRDLTRRRPAQRSGRRPVRRAGDVLAIGSAVTGALEGDLRWTPLSDRLARQPSVNVVARIRPAGPARRRVCLCGHLDTSRSGLMFNPRLARHLAQLLQIPVASSLALAAGPALRRLPGGRALNPAALAGIVFSLAILLERELLGEDVPGASDNASGTAVALQLAAECAATPLQHTEVDVLITSCEESGLLGAQAYARRHRLRAARDHVPELRHRRGRRAADLHIAGGRRGDHPSGARPPDRPARGDRRAPARAWPGARRDDARPPTDATPMRARGWDAVTLLAQGETIPNYHWPTDTYENIAAVHRAANARDRARAAARARRSGTPGLGVLAPAGQLRSPAHVHGCGATFTVPPRRARRVRRRVPTSDPDAGAPRCSVVSAPAASQLPAGAGLCGQGGDTLANRNTRACGPRGDAPGAPAESDS